MTDYGMSDVDRVLGYCPWLYHCGNPETARYLQLMEIGNMYWILKPDHPMTVATDHQRDSIMAGAK